ncbi:MAG TPA: outer membrane beta-barrel protein, partial [Tepidisphaeraceae bacterium]|nr:outer membrane beta-barrel protein [Tepidisphaeraceae bacterium]
MYIRRVSAALTAAFAALIGASWAAASDSIQAPSALSLTPSIYADDATPPPKPLMALLDKAGIGKALGDWNITIGGFIEGGWTYNFSQPGDQTNVGRVFDFEDQDPTLDQVDLFIDRSVDASKGKFDVGFHIEWIYGGDARLIHSNGMMDNVGVGNGPDEQFDPVQAYATFAIPVGSGLTVTAGKFVTLLGYEYINPTQNPLYSHSYLFGFAIPFTNTGVIAKYNITDKISVTAGFTRGWEQSLKDNNGSIDGIGEVTWQATDKLGLILNVISGPEEPNDSSHYRTVVDGTATYKIGDN